VLADQLGVRRLRSLLAAADQRQHVPAPQLHPTLRFGHPRGGASLHRASRCERASQQRRRTGCTPRCTGVATGRRRRSSGSGALRRARRMRTAVAGRGGDVGGPAGRRASTLDRERRETRSLGPAPRSCRSGGGRGPSRDRQGSLRVGDSDVRAPVEEGCARYGSMLSLPTYSPANHTFLLVGGGGSRPNARCHSGCTARRP
jgi:hypothetical protein